MQDRGIDPVRDTQAVFRVALEALARPGRVYQLPVAAGGAPGHPWAAALLLTLLDHETSLWVTPAPPGDGLDAFLRQRSGARRAPLEGAGYALAGAGGAGEDDLPARLCRGSLAYPDGGATLVLAVPRLDAGPEGEPSGGPSGAGFDLTFSGPGVPAQAPRTLRVPGVPGAFWAARQVAVQDYPLGIDCFLVDGAGRLVGLPRSTRLEVRNDGL